MNIRTMLKSFAVLTATTMLALGAKATDYYWIGGESGEWTDGTKWSLSAGGEAAGAYPGSSDTATFSSDAAITLTTAETKVGTVAIATDVRVQFSSDDYKALLVGAVTGEATSTIALANVIVVANAANAPIGGQIELVEGTTNGLYATSSQKSSTPLYINGNMIGSGVVYFRNYNTSGNRSGVYLYGDNSQFSGDAHVLMAKGADMKGVVGYATAFKWMTAESGSSKARWFIEGNDGSNGPVMPSPSLTSAENPFRITPVGTYNLQGGANANYYLECGSSRDSEYSGKLIRGSNCNGFKIVKVGTGTMTLSNEIQSKNSVTTVTVKEGAFKVGATAAFPQGGIIMAGGTLKTAKVEDVKIDPSAKISSASTDAIIYDDEGDDSVWTTAISKSFTHGLTKKGEGTLTLSAAPAYTGTTTVEGGILMLPTKDLTLGGALCANGGKIGFGEELSGGDETLLTWTTEGSSVTIEDFNVTVEAPFELKMVDNEGMGTTSLVVSHPETSFTWTGADDNRWENAKNWLVNGEETEFYPGENDTVVIALENQKIAITPDVLFGTFQTLADTTQFVILFANEGDAYAIPTEKVSADKFSVAQPFTASSVLSEGVYTAGARVSATYTWAGKDGAWSDAASWRIGGEHTGAYPIMVKTAGDEKGTADSATFESSTTVTLTQHAQVSTLTIADSVRVAFASDVVGTLRDLQVLEYDCGASSTMALAFVNVFPRQSQAAAQTLTIGGYVEIVDNTTNGIYATSWRVDSSNKPVSDVELTGNLIGGGALTVGSNNNQNRGYFYFKGDNSAFTGVVLGTHYSSDGVQWCNENAGSASAIWNLSQLDSKALKITSPAGTTNKFGRLISNGVTLGNSNGAILEIGALGGESTLDLASGTFDVIKVGTGNLTIDGNQTGNVRIEAGTVTVGSANAILLSVNRAFTFAGGTLVNAYGTDMSPYLANCATTTSAIVINDCGVDAIWAKSLPAAAQGGFTKKGAGTLSLSAIPAYSGATIVEEGTLRLPMGTVIDTLDVKSGATLGLYVTTNLTEVTKIFTISNLAEGVELATAIPNTGATTYTFEQDTETGVWTVKAVRASVFTWSGAVDTAWENADNWLVNGSAVTEIPTSVDTVVFPAKDEGNWSVTVSRDTHIVGMTNNAPVTLTGEGDIYLGSISSELEDAPALTLGDNATIRSENQRDAVLTIDVPLNIAASAEYPAGVYGRWMKDSGGNSSLYINRELLGDGYVEMKQSRGGIYFNGTNTAFAGSIKIFDDSSLSGQTRTAPRFTLPESTSSNAVWDICNYTSLLQDGGKTYYFGSLSGSITLNTTQSSYKQNTLEIGARDDVDSVLGGNFFANSYINLAGDRGNTIRKVGDSTLTTTAIHVRAYELNGGLTVLNHNRAVHTRWNGEKTEVTEESEEAEHCYDIPISFGGGVLALGDGVIVDPSANFVNSTAPIAFDDRGTNVTWATAIAASNVGGITKKGEGTLTLTADAGFLTNGLTKVEAGMLVLPENTTVTLDADSTMNISNATIVGYAFAEGKTIVWESEPTEVQYNLDGPLDVSNLTVDVGVIEDWSTNREIPIASATKITGRENAKIVNLPEEGKDWHLAVQNVNGKQTLVLMKVFGLGVFIF